MDNIEIKTSSMLSNGSAKPEPSLKAAETSASQDPPNNSDTPPVLPTPQQVEHILSTWKMVKDGVTLDTAGMLLFVKLFEIAPDLKDLFPFSKGTNHDEALKKHGLLVMESIDTAISLLGDGNFEELKDTLIELGIVHNMKEVQLDSFAPVGQALVWTLGQGLQDKFTDEVKTAWITLYTVVQHFMTQGMKEGLDDI